MFSSFNCDWDREIRKGYAFMKNYSKEQGSGCGFLSVFSNIGNKLGDIIKTVMAIGIISAILICLIYEDLIIAGLLTGIAIGLDL